MEIVIIILTLTIVLMSLFFYFKRKKYFKVKNADNEIKEKYDKAEKEYREKLRTIEIEEHLILRFRVCISNAYNHKLLEERKALDSDLKLIKDLEKVINDKNEYIKELEYRKIDMQNEIKEIEMDIYDMDYGLYKPEYSFITSQEYKDKLVQVKFDQKQVIRNKKACICDKTWTVDSSKTEGKKMINRSIKMMLRAFNGECDALVAKVNHKNISTVLKKLDKSFEIINRINEVLDCSITHRYHHLRREEIKLVYEYNEMVYKEKEEQRIIMRQVKEEEKAQKEFEKELIKAEKEAKRYQKALEQARDELKDTAEKEKLRLEDKIRELEIKLEEAEKNMRAISQAQITKAGYVYIISNIGSFGEKVYKIGMSRRIKPYERIKELNGPSIPYNFDVHSMIFSSNAPQLELTLHKELAYCKMNRVNKRKEFFNTDLETIVNIARKHCGNKIEIQYEHEAKEYRMSEKIKEENTSANTALPNTPF